MFVNWDFVQKHNIETTPLQSPIPVHNVDGTLNENRMITEEAHILLQMGSHQEHARLVVTNLRRQTVIIRHSWLLRHNPEVDWTNQKITFTRCPPECQNSKTATTLGNDTALEPGDAIYAAFIPKGWADKYIHATTTPSQQFAQRHRQTKASGPSKT